MNAHRAGEVPDDTWCDDEACLHYDHPRRDKAPAEDSIALKAENARLRAQVARVEALCWDAHEQYVYAPDLRAALAGEDQ